MKKGEREDERTGKKDPSAAKTKARAKTNKQDTNLPMPGRDRAQDCARCVAGGLGLVELYP